MMMVTVTMVMMMMMMDDDDDMRCLLRICERKLPMHTYLLEMIYHSLFHLYNIKIIFFFLLPFP